MKPPTTAQRNLMNRIRRAGGKVMTSHLDRQEFHLANGERLNPFVARNCVRRGYLVASGDGLPGLGVTQTFHVAS